MILNKISTSLSIGVIITTPILFSTSCSCVRELHLNEQQKFIYDRTFSIMGRNGNTCVFGTGWIISDPTPKNNSDYVYWLATNWHVTYGMKSAQCSKFYYADNSLTNGRDFINYADYKQFNSFVVESDDKFLYEQAVTEPKWYQSIDLHVVKVDFGSPSGEIKNKLDSLNAYQKQHNYINKFVKYDSTIAKKDKIIGGYPMKNSGDYYFGGQWETHSYHGDDFTFYTKAYKYDGVNCGHAINKPYYNQLGERIEGGTDAYGYWDISPQYIFNSTVGTDFMSGGASGSMMITKDYEVCGIYWGGWSNSKQTWFKPSFSIFQHDEYDFLENYK